MAINLVRRAGSPNWYMRGTLRGVEVFESTGVASRRQAQAILEATQRRIIEIEAAGGRPTITFKEAALLYLEKGGEARYLGSFDEGTGRWSLLLGYFGDTPLSEIGDAEITACARTIYPDARPSTINRQVYTPVSAIFNKAGVAPRTKLRRVREKKPVTTYARKEHFGEIMGALEGLPHLQLLCITMATTGRRVSEVVGIERDDVDWGSGLVDLGRTKNGEEVSIRLPDWLLEQIERLPRFGNGRLFGYLTRDGVTATLKRRCAQAGVRFLSPHKLGRHTFATNAMRGGMNLKQVMAAGGWRSIQSVSRYLHVDPAEESHRASEIVREGLDLCRIRAVCNPDRNSDDTSTP